MTNLSKLDKLSSSITSVNDYIDSLNNLSPGISDWSERNREVHHSERRVSPLGIRDRGSPIGFLDRGSPIGFRDRGSPLGIRDRGSPVAIKERISPVDRLRSSSPMDRYRDVQSPVDRFRDVQRSPMPDYRMGRDRDNTPTPPQRKKGPERRQRISQVILIIIKRFSNSSANPNVSFVFQESRYDSGYRTPSRNDIRDEPLEEPAPDYSPPSPPPMPVDKKHQKTRFAADPPKAKSGNIIGEFQTFSYSRYINTYSFFINNEVLSIYHQAPKL